MKWVMMVATVLMLGQLVEGADFDVSTPNGDFAYTINGVGGNPTITLMRGKSYTFNVHTSSIHPFEIAKSVFGPIPPGVSGNNTSAGIITYNVPVDAQDGVYFCSFHGFSGGIHLVDAPTPPEVRIVGLKVGTNLSLTLKQASTNGFSFIPEANTNLAAKNWFALTVQTNKFADGTNEVICGKPFGTNVFVRVRVQ